VRAAPLPPRVRGTRAADESAIGSSRLGATDAVGRRTLTRLLPPRSGYGAFTQSVPPDTASFDTETTQAWDRRLYKTLTLTSATGPKDEDVVFNGWAELRLNGPQAKLRYYTFGCAGGNCTGGGPSFDYADKTELATETFVVQSTGDVALVEQQLSGSLQLTSLPPPVANVAPMLAVHEPYVKSAIGSSSSAPRAIAGGILPRRARRSGRSRAQRVHI